MLNWWLVIIAVIVSIMILGIAVYMVVLFTAEVDRGTAWFPKIVVVFSISLSCFMLLLLPFDVANRRDPTTVKKYVDQDLDTAALWEILIWVVAVNVCVVLPFTTFYYEGYDPDHDSALQQIVPALLYTFLILIIAGVLIGLLWATVGDAMIPYASYTAVQQYKPPDDPNLVYAEVRSIQILPIHVSIFVYVAGLLSFFGWFLFLAFGAVGLAALPYDYFKDWKNRPKPVSSAELESQKAIFADRAAVLLKKSEELHRKQLTSNTVGTRRKIDALRIEVYALQDDFEKVKAAAEPSYFLMGVLQGLIGVACFILTVMWLLQILLYSVLRYSDFLAAAMVALDKAFSLLGVIFYIVFSFYLLWCTGKGCVKVGVRLVFFTIHPLKVGDTLMNAFLFNCGLILLTSVAVAQFCSMAFNPYVENSIVDTLLNVFVRRLRGIGDAMYYFQYVFPLVALLSVSWIIFCPADKAKRDRVTKKKA